MAGRKKAGPGESMRRHYEQVAVRFVQIAKRNRVTPDDLEAFRCQSEEEFRQRVFRALEHDRTDPELLAIEMSLAGVLYPDMKTATLGSRREKFMKEHEISLSTTIRWERAGGMKIVLPVVAPPTKLDDSDSGSGTSNVYRVSGQPTYNRQSYNEAVAEIITLQSTVDDLQQQVKDLRSKVDARDRLINRCRDILNAPLDRD
ncbi:MAG: hypothetical protein WA972_05570 [Rhodococcus qingshengii]